MSNHNEKQRRGKNNSGSKLLCGTLLLVAMLLVTQMSLVSADILTTRHYVDNDMKVEFRTLGLIYIGDMTLTSHKSVDDIKFVMPGEDRQVHCYDFDFKNKETPALGEILFKDENTGEYFERDYHFEENTYKMVEVPATTRKVCSKGIDEEDFDVEIDCVDEVIEAYARREKISTRILDTNEIEKGKREICLVTDVYQGEKVDTIWTVIGEKIDKHSVWEASLEVGLLAWFSFEETSGGQTEERVFGVYNLTDQGSVDQDVEGILGNGASLTSNAFLNSSNFESGTSGSMQCWVNMSTMSTAAVMGFSNGVAEYQYLGFRNFGGDDNLEYIVNANQFLYENTSQGLDFSDDQWHLITWTFDDGGNWKAYRDGSANTEITFSAGVNTAWWDDLTGLNQFNIGKVGRSTDLNPYTGLVDECGIWNRSLSADEVFDLWNDGVGIKFDGEAPAPTPGNISVTLNTPVDNFNSTLIDIDFNCSANLTDYNSTIVNMSLYHNESGTFELNQTNDITGAQNSTAFTSNFGSGGYEWSCEACAVDGNCSLSDENRTLNIITTINVTLDSPVDDYTSPLNEVQFDCSSNVTGTTLSNISLYHNESGTFGLNQTNAITGEDNSTSFTSIFPEGNYSWSCEACALDGTCTGLTENRTLTIDLPETTINVTLDSPVDDYTSPLNEVQFDCSTDVNGSTLTNISLYHDYSGSFILNQTIDVAGTENSTSFNSTFSKGSYEWSCESCINDGSCALASENRTLNIDTIDEWGFSEGIPTTDEHGYAYTTQSFSDKTGVKITPNQNGTITTIGYTPDTTATTAYIMSSTETILASINIVGDIATFNFEVEEGVKYILAADSNGSSYDQAFSGIIGAFPIANTSLEWTFGYSEGEAGNGDTDRISNIDNVTIVSGLAFSNYVNATSPVNNFNSSATEVEFGCEVNLTDSSIVNVSLFHNGTGTFELNQTKPLFGKVNTTTFNSTFVSGGYEWTCGACALDGSCGSGLENRSLIIDQGPPVINLIAPEGFRDFNIIGEAEYLNWTISDSSLDSCWYDYNGTNQTVTCGDNNITFDLEFDNLNITLYANDTFGNTQANYSNWSYNLIQNSVDFSVQTTSGALENYTLNITSSDVFTGIAIVLNYNGTNYTMETTDTGLTKEYTAQVTVISVVTETDVDFQFITSLSNATGTTQIILPNQTQTISPFLIDNCTLNPTELLSFSMLDEDSFDEINGTIEITVKIFSVGTTDLINSFNASFDYVVGESSRVCVQNINEDYSMSYQIRHFGDELQYFKKYRNVQLSLLNNLTLSQNVTLYNLNQSRGKAFNVIVVGNILSTTGNAGLLVDAQRQYLSLDQFITVESPVTDSEGIAIANLVEASEIYNFLISLNGELLGTFNNYQVKCANSALGQCSITLNLALSTGSQPDFVTAGNITQLFLLDEDANTLHHSFISTDSQSKDIRSLVLKDNGFGNTTICNATSSGTSGTFLCAIPTQFQNVSIFVQTFEDEVLIGSKYFSQGPGVDWQGADILIMLLMFSSLALLFVGHPIAIIIGSMLGLTMPALLISVSSASFGSLFGAVLFYIAAGIIAIIVINRRKV